MKRGINKVILIGNLGQDPEVRYNQGGGAVASITLATSESWRDKLSGEQKERTEWHRVVFWGALAEVAGKHLKKGTQVYVEGKLQTRKWQAQDGSDRYTTEVLVDSFTGVLQMLGSRPQQGQPQQPPASQPHGGHNRQAQQPAPPVYNEPPIDFDDDLPF